MVFPRFFGARSGAAAGHRLYVTLVEQARRPDFYRHLGVPDTVDGRFEMIALHVFLVLYRLKGETDAATRDLARTLSEAMFDDMDRSLREMGAGDLGVGRRVQAMAEGFYGRVAAYDAGLAVADSATLGDALRRNVYGSLRAAGPEAPQIAGLATYVFAAVAALGACSVAQLAAADPAWPPISPAG